MADLRRPGLDAATAAVRGAVRATLAALTEPGDVVLVACSGGADSLALASALAFEADRAGVSAGAVTVDHGLQPGSAERSTALAARLIGLGLQPVTVHRAVVGSANGPEAAARAARYAELAAAARNCGARVVLLGHTRDDQAETVLLGLARGSGPRSLAGMRDIRPAFATTSSEDDDDRKPSVGVPVTELVFARPLLDLPRSTTAAACAAAGLMPWVDPHNADPAFARTRARERVLPVLEAELGPGIAEALARSAALLRDDADALDALAEEVGRVVGTPTGGVDVQQLIGHPRAVRTRVLRTWLIAAGAPASALTRSHVLAVDALLTAWRGQGPIAIPGGIRVLRERSPAGGPVLRSTPAT